ncbi:MAG TPA: amidohydrolase family protein, partial [Terriglobia bacterium]|nr:amidohydrolase family protein [Terriglobia bacterium]
MESLSRRKFLGELAAVGAGALVSGAAFGTQRGSVRAGKINIHHHLTAPAYVKFLTDNKVRDFPNRSVAEGLEDMDKAGIATAFTSIIGPGLWFGSVQDTRRLARECNDFAAKLMSDYPGRFGLFASLPLPDIDGSLKEIEYAYETLKADGIYLFTNFGQTPLYGDKYLGDPMLAPIYEELNRRKAIVYTHPKDNYCCRDVIPGVGSATIEYGTDTTRAIQSLLTSGTAAKYPEVRFIFSHGGGTAP